MKTMHIWLLPAAAALLVVAPAFAWDGGGEVEASQGHALPSHRVSPEERAEARQERRMEGREAARDVIPGDAEVPETTAERGGAAHSGPRKHFETAKERRAAERAMGAPPRRGEPEEPLN